MLGLRPLLTAFGGLLFFASSPMLIRKFHHVEASTVRSKQAPFSKASSEGEKRRCQHHLVVHIGPHKTGSSAVQTFLVKKRKFLRKSFGISTGTFAGAKSPSLLRYALREVTLDSKHSIKVQKRRKHEAESILRDINSRLGKQDIVLSSEAFSQWSSGHWDRLKSRLADSGRCMRLVMVHRRESDQMVSQFTQWEKFHKSPASFGYFLLQHSKHFTPDYQVMMWNRAVAAAPAGVVGVSYEYLKESHYSFAAFLICNATLRREGPSWKLCVASITREERTFSAVQNVSPLLVVMDVVRLAQGLQHQNGCKTQTFRELQKRKAVPRVAKQMPMVCGNFDAQFKHGEDAWFNLSSAARPRVRSQSDATCLLDESSLNKTHWELIRTLACEA
eukprot:Skav220319  [mRNA]  locus=scaffold972:106649:107815:- [translate_table: standard]